MPEYRTQKMTFSGIFQQFITKGIFYSLGYIPLVINPV